MELTVNRYLKHPKCTIGKLLINTVLTCYTLEDPIRVTKIKGETAIPYGRYEVGLRQSPKFSTNYYVNNKGELINKVTYQHLPPEARDDYRPHDLIWIKDVPGYTYILLHWGNTDLDTEGCLIVGNRLGVVYNREAVLNSVQTYLKIYPIIVQGIQSGKSYITYTP